MNWKRVIAVLLVVTMASLCAGCSFMSAQLTPTQWNKCSSPYTLPIIDTVSGVIAGSTSVVFLAGSFGEWNLGNFGDKAIYKYGGIFLLSAAVFYFASAVYGYYHASECSDSKKESGDRT